MFCICEDINLGIGVVEAAASFVFSNFCILLVPIVMIIFSCGFIAYWIATTLYVYSIGDITQYKDTPFPSVDWDRNTNNLWYYLLVAIFWGLAFLLAIEQFIIAATATQWYFTSNSDQGGSGSVCKSVWWTFRYHLGSLAFGSLILAIVNLIRFIFEYMRKKVEAGGAENKCTKCLFSCASCCLKCIGEIVLYITKNAYVQVCLSKIIDRYKKSLFLQCS